MSSMFNKSGMEGMRNEGTMPVLKLTDGRSFTVSYDDASLIKAVIDGLDASGIKQKHRDLAMQAEDIEFKQRKIEYLNRRDVEHDPQVDQIMEDRQLTGYEKFQAIGLRIRERVVIN